MNKRLLSVILVISMIAGALTGCQKEQNVEVTEENNEVSSDVVNLCVWAEEDNFDMLNQMIDSFKEHYAAEAEFNITLKAQADSSAKDVILSDIHSVGDVFSFPDDQFYGLMSAGMLEPVANQAEVVAANIEGAIDAASYKGTLYAFPYTADNGYFMYYNKQYFNESDLKTLDGMLEAANKAEKKISMELNSGWYMYAFFGNTGLEFGINEDGVTNYCNWNATDTPIKGTDIAEAMIAVIENPAFVVKPDGEFVDAAKSGEVIAGVSGTWNAMGIKEAWGDDYAAVKLPTYTVAGQQVQMSSFTGYKMMGVNAYSENKEWAMKLAEWLTNEENQTLRFEIKNQGPSNKNASASPSVTAVPAIQAVIDQSQYGNLQRVGGKYWTPCTEFVETLMSDNKRSVPLQEIMDTLVDGITQSVAK
ncbi:MAG: extracellular solute-binding protein [Lachnospiraceae bacterium]